jgi:16S rRNA (uracil1498-N3)-methyltransferase
VTLEAEAANHVARVLRLRAGTEVVLFNGEGGEYAGHLAAIERRQVLVDLGAFHAKESESPLRITLVQGISRGERMDYTIQKAVELGVERVVPVVTERTVVNLDRDRSEKRLAHWRGVIVSACEQSGRTRIPQLMPITPLGLHLEQEPPAHGFLLDPYAASGLARQARPDGAISLLIGPEGGLSEREREQSRRAGYIGVRLGPRILRTETAALAAMAAMLALWGDLGD